MIYIIESVNKMSITFNLKIFISRALYVLTAKKDITTYHMSSEQLIKEKVKTHRAEEKKDYHFRTYRIKNYTII